MTVCTKPESVSTPMWAFIPKCHWLPFLVLCISGSRSPRLFLVELGAAIKVASTTVPVLSISPFVAKVALMVAISWQLRLCFSSKCLNRKIVVSLG